MRGFLFLSLFLLLPVILFAQKRIVPTAEQIERFSRTTTNVVLTGEDMLLDAALRTSMEKKWKITPLVFVDKEEFEKNMDDANRSFLIVVGGTFRKDKERNSYTFLNLLMGGAVALNQLAEFILLPITCEGQSEDKPLLFMDAYIDIIQRHVQQMQANPKLAKQDLDGYNVNLDRLRRRYLIIADEDFAYDVTEEELKEQFNDKLLLSTEEDLIEAVETKAKNKIAGLTLYPRIGNEKGSYCYNMLIACDTHELIYFKRHKITGKNQQGFLREEIKRFGVYSRKK